MAWIIGVIRMFNSKSCLGYTMSSHKDSQHFSGKHSLANLEYNAQVYEKYFRYLRLDNPGKILNIGFVSFSELFEVLLPRLPETFQDFVVCDASKEVIDFARGTQRGNRVRFIQMDIEEPKGPPSEMKGQFDHLFSSYTLGVLSDLKQTLKNSYELLNEGGDLLFLFAKYDPAFCTYQEMAKNPKWLPYLKKYIDYSSTVEKEIGSKEKIISWFESLRFKVQAVSIDENVSCQYSKGDLIEITDFLDVVQEQIPKKDLKFYKEEYHKYFLDNEAISQHVDNGEDIWRLKLPTVIVVAKK